MSGYIEYRSSFVLSPIYLTGSSTVTSGVDGGVVPLISLIALSPAFSVIDANEYFAHFVPMPGATMLDFQVATYPFANQAVAGNAIIAQPLQIAMKMLVPVKSPGGYFAKYSAMQSLRDTLYQHSTHGGTYTVVTPSYPFTNALLTKMTDISGGESAQAQIAWQMDFTRPLLTIEEATAAQNGLISKISAGGQVTSSDLSGSSASSAAQAGSGATASGLTSGVGGQAVTASGASGSIASGSFLS